MTYDVVILGLGYVGLPLAQQATRVGMSVLGFDVKADVVNALSAGRSHVDDLGDFDVAEMVAAGFTPTTDETRIADASVAVICVPTPLAEGDGPDLRAVIGATEAVARNLRPGMLVVLESTTYPGTTDDVVRPLLEQESGPGRRGRLPPGVLAGADRPGQREVRCAQHPEGRRRLHAGLRRPGGGVLRPVHRDRRADPGHPGGRDREAAGEHVPARQHRAGQRDGAVLPRARHRPVGRHPRRVDQAVRVPGVLPGPGRRRALHPDRPELPEPQRAQQARLPVPLRRAGPGDQRDDAGVRGPAGAEPAQRGRASRCTGRRCCCSG